MTHRGKGPARRRAPATAFCSQNGRMTAIREQIVANGRDPAIEVVVQQRPRRCRRLREAGARHVVLSTSGDWLRAFAGFLLRKDGYR